MKYALVRYTEQETETGLKTCFQFLTEDKEFWSAEAIEHMNLKRMLFQTFEQACRFYVDNLIDLYKQGFTYVIREYIELKVLNESEVDNE